MSQAQRVTELLSNGILRASANPVDLRAPQRGTVPWERVAGMLLGLAVGDALGNTSESMQPGRRRAAHGEIRDYLPNHHVAGRAVGLPSDDTQLAFWTLEQMLEDDRLDPARLAAKFASRGRIFGIGQTVGAFLSAYRDRQDWTTATQVSAGNGALMRIAPIVLPHLAAPSTALWCDALLAGAVTHNDYASNAACVAFVRVLWNALVAKHPVRPGFWLEPFVETARMLEGEEARYAPRAPRLAGRRNTLWALTDALVREALQTKPRTVDACDSWYSGAFLLETVPSVLYVLERHGNDPEEAIVRAVNDTRDNDTIAAIVGAAVGALHGVDAIPARWRDGLLGRTAHDDDGRVEALLDEASARWGHAPAPAPATMRRSRSSFRGCLLGGAVGDALGAPVEFIRRIDEIRARFGPEGVTDFAPAYGRIGAITDDTQMMLFTAEALIRAHHRASKGLCHPPSVAHHAYLRWLRTQGGRGSRSSPADSELDGWLVTVRALHVRRAPGTTCLDALESGRMGTRDEPINDSKGCGGVMRVAPVGLVPHEAFDLGADFAAITHGHPTGWNAAGYFAAVVQNVAAGMALREAAIEALEPLRRSRGHEETLAAIQRALALAQRRTKTPDAVASLGEGWVAEEALAIGLYCALVADGFAEGVLLAVNHGGDSDSTGSIAGNLLGLVHGEEGIPAGWLEQLELRDVIAEVSDDLWLHFGEGRPTGECSDFGSKYPGG
jgi:ADP-ribosyl-[dinitrogen reductase] hydrolase